MYPNSNNSNMSYDDYLISDNSNNQQRIDMPTPAPEVPRPDRPRPEMPPVITDREYLQGYLNTLIGQFVRVDFLMGTNTFMDRSGYLLDVGVDYIVLQEPESDDYQIADLYSIKFVRVLR
ncbi:hypothetical protein GOQ29_03150 [Clostridium sp. D2Q-14]|uniref:hypothetical protein n=1 Tax=Anaeromonas gelatinilytica TaxID=2683194 RepID=UPI00193C1BE0|nr:hypothetical protein [Anaeromonas gelatinilytica]MBS4534606.1 hypothetical protein [Anaeromonas gelatinilytica]